MADVNLVMLNRDVLESIFKHLDEKDLVSCSKVSIIWREAANSDHLWAKICAKFSWTDPNALIKNKSSFVNNRYSFTIPDLSDRLVPVNRWKLHYSKEKFIYSNWYRGNYVTHWFGQLMKMPNVLTFASVEPLERVLLPVIELSGKDFELNVKRIDGKPRTVGVLEEKDAHLVTNVCVLGDMIAYVISSNLKVLMHSNGEFNLVHEFKLQACSDDIRNLRSILVCPDNQFISMNESFIIGGYKHNFINVWCLKSGEKLALLEPKLNFTFSVSCLFKDMIYFGTNGRTIEMDGVEELVSAVNCYNITKKQYQMYTRVNYLTSKIICNDLYVVYIFNTDINSNEIIVYTHNATGSYLKLVRQDVSENWAVQEPQVLLVNSLLFYLEGYLIKVISLTDPDMKPHEFKISSVVASMHSIRQNLLVIRTKSEVEIWDWEKGIKLHTPCTNCESHNLFYDDSRLILIKETIGEARVIGFW